MALRALFETVPRRHLVLHMDINKTIIQVDAAAGKSMENVLNSNVAANVLGLVTGDGWKAVVGPGEEAPEHIDVSELISYDQYVDNTFCEPTGMQDLPKLERDAVWKQVTAARRAATGAFTSPGEVGSKYASLVDEQKQCLTCGDGPTFHSIVPSFFHLVNSLSELNWPFTLIFRTFGSDLASVMAEWGRFVQGNHVCKPRGSILEHMKKSSVEPWTACIYRDGDDLFLCHGPAVSATAANIHEEIESAIIQALESLPGAKRAKRISFESFNSEVLGSCTDSSVGGLVDYYPCWARSAERRIGGKVFPVAGSSPIYNIFFDDNIFLGDERSIVDVRDKHSSSILGEVVERPFCVPVNAYQAIVREDYFEDCLCQCLKLQAEMHL